MHSRSECKLLHRDQTIRSEGLSRCIVSVFANGINQHGNVTGSWDSAACCLLTLVYCSIVRPDAFSTSMSPIPSSKSSSLSESPATSLLAFSASVICTMFTTNSCHLNFHMTEQLALPCFHDNCYSKSAHLKLNLKALSSTGAHAGVGIIAANAKQHSEVAMCSQQQCGAC